MDQVSKQFNLLKINLVIVGVVLTAVKLDVERNSALVLIGGGTLLFSILYQYISLVPGFHIKERTQHDMKKESWDVNILMSLMAFLFLIVGFSGPTLDNDLINFFPRNFQAILLYIFAPILGYLRYLSLEHADSRDWTRTLLCQFIVGYLVMVLSGLIVILVEYS